MEDEAGQRIDNYLMRQLKGVPRSHVYRIVRKGEVRVNKGRIRPEYRLKAGDQVRIPPVRINKPDEITISHQHLQQVQDVLYEDERLLIINKPSGLAVHGGSGLQYGLIEVLRKARPDAHFLELVHRLDRGTSGCLMIAKKRSELRNLHELLRETRVDKRYLAMVRGEWQGGKQVVEAPLKKGQLRSGERIVRVSADGKYAKTRFSPVLVTPQFSLLEARPSTGRTHQIRVHAAHIGFPLAGDDKYGDETFNRLMHEEKGLKRLFLHARSLAFQRPGADNRIQVNAPLSPELARLLDGWKGV